MDTDQVLYPVKRTLGQLYEALNPPESPSKKMKMTLPLPKDEHPIQAAASGIRNMSLEDV
jgi:hypothetical protein